MCFLLYKWEHWGLDAWAALGHPLMTSWSLHPVSFCCDVTVSLESCSQLLFQVSMWRPQVPPGRCTPFSHTVYSGRWCCPSGALVGGVWAWQGSEVLSMLWHGCGYACLQMEEAPLIGSLGAILTHWWIIWFPHHLIPYHPPYYLSTRGVKNHEEHSWSQWDLILGKKGWAFQGTRWITKQKVKLPKCV